MLQSNDTAPDFSLLAAVEGKVEQVSLDSLLHDHAGLVITSYPLDFTGGCQNQLSEFRDAYDEFSAFEFRWHQ